MGQMPVGQMPVGQMPVGQMPVGQMPVGQMPLGQMPLGQMPFGQKARIPFWVCMLCVLCLKLKNGKKIEKFKFNASPSTSQVWFL